MLILIFFPFCNACNIIIYFCIYGGIIYNFFLPWVLVQCVFIFLQLNYSSRKVVTLLICLLSLLGLVKSAFQKENYQKSVSCHDCSDLCGVAIVFSFFYFQNRFITLFAWINMCFYSFSTLVQYFRFICIFFFVFDNNCSHIFYSFIIWFIGFFLFINRYIIYNLI